MKQSHKVSKEKQRRHGRNEFILQSVDLQYSGRPPVETTYVEPTLFQCAHEIHRSPAGHSLYLGPMTAASLRARDALKSSNVVAIVNCTTRVPSVHRKIARYCQVPIRDQAGANILIYLEGATTFVDAMLQEGSVLVHCEVGMSRSSSVVMAYLMRFQGMTYGEAYVHCKSKRPMVNPNEGFWTQLIQYGKILEEQQAMKQPSGTVVVSSCPSPLVSDWAKQSQALFTTCREIPDVLRNSSCWKELGTVEKSTLSTFLFVCLDFVWGRGVSELDVEWLVYVCCDEVLHGNGIGNSSFVLEALTGQLTNPESEFCESWSGECHEPELSRVIAAIDKARMT